MNSKLKLSAIACTVTLVLSSPGVKAALPSDLDNILSAVGSVHITSPAGVTPETLLDPLRPGVDFGRVRVRIPHFTPQIFSFTPPSVNSSCSSMDIIGGSFSMMSLNDLIQLLRNITAGTLTYALGQSIRSLCPPCWTGITDIQKKIQQANDMLQNSCQISQELGQKLSDGFKSARCSVVDSEGYVGDFWECQNNEANDGQESINNAALAETKTEKPAMGNLVYEALTPYHSSNQFPLSNIIFGVTGFTDVEIIMNLVGTKIVRETGSPVEQGPVLFPEQFSTIVSGVENIDNKTLKLWKCSGSISTTGLPSASSKTYQCMDPDPIANTSAITPLGKVINDLIAEGDDSIYGKLATANTTGGISMSTFSDAQIKLFNHIDSTLAAAMLFSNNPLSSANKQMFELIAEVVRHDMSFQYYHSAHSAVSEVPVLLAKKYSDETIDFNVADLQKTLLQLGREAYENRGTAMMKLLEMPHYIETIKKYNTDREKSQANM